LETTFSVERRNSLNALRLVRDSELFPAHVRDQIHVQNSENHLIYMSGVFLILSAVGLKVTGANPLVGIGPSTLVVLAFVLFILGMGISISTCKQLCAQIASLDAQKLETLLTNSQLRPPANTRMEPPRHDT
jgi:hypothetical protein